MWLFCSSRCALHRGAHAYSNGVLSGGSWKDINALVCPCNLVQCRSLKGWVRVSCSNFATPSSPLHQRPSLEVTRNRRRGGVCGGGILSKMQETFSSPLLLNINVALLGPHYSSSFPVFLLLYHFLLTPAVRVWITQSPPFPTRSPPLLSTRTSLASSHPDEPVLFERFRWHLNSSHRFPYGRGLRVSSLKELKSTI